MSKTTNNINRICNKEEFERFKSFYELFTEYMKEGDLPSEQVEQLFEDINNFETTIVPIARKVGIDLSKHVDCGEKKIKKTLDKCLTMCYNSQ